MSLVTFSINFLNIWNFSLLRTLLSDRFEINDFKKLKYFFLNSKLTTISFFLLQVFSLQTDLDNSVAVQNDFVRLSQNLQMELEKIRQAKSLIFNIDPISPCSVLYDTRWKSYILLLQESQARAGSLNRDATADAENHRQR